MENGIMGGNLSDNDNPIESVGNPFKMDGQAYTDWTKRAGEALIAVFAKSP
jgi:hypothetical protein